MSTVDENTALAEFDRFEEAMDLDFNIQDMTEDDLSTFNRKKRRIIRAVMRGFMVFNDDGEAIYTPNNKSSKYKEPITFHQRSGKSTMAMDSIKKGQDMHKTYAVMGEMCKVPPNVFAGLVGTDIKVCEDIFVLLMD